MRPFQLMGIKSSCSDDRQILNMTNSITIVPPISIPTTSLQSSQYLHSFEGFECVTSFSNQLVKKCFIFAEYMNIDVYCFLLSYDSLTSLSKWILFVHYCFYTHSPRTTVSNYSKQIYSSSNFDKMFSTTFKRIVLTTRWPVSNMMRDFSFAASLLRDCKNHISFIEALQQFLSFHLAGEDCSIYRT